MPLDSVCLRIKSMGISDLSSFPFPTPPPLSAIRRAEQLLSVLGMLNSEDGKVGSLKHSAHW